MQECIRILFHIHMKLNMFRAVCRPKHVELHKYEYEIKF
jgi:hypothetical protein